MFNDKLREELQKYLSLKAAPVMPGLAESTMALSKLRDQLRDDGTPPPSPVGTDDLPPAAQPISLADFPAKPGLPGATPPAVSSPTAPSISPTGTPAPQIPQPQAPLQNALGTKYDDNARQQLYADLAKKHTQNAGWAAVGSLGDMAEKMGGGTSNNTQQTILAQGKQDDTLARDQFDAGRKGKLEDVSTNLALTKAGREETEYKDQNDPNSQMSKLAAGFAAQMLGADRTAKMGWAPGKTSYADVAKVLPVVEKYVSLETARAAKDVTLGQKKEQFNESLTTRLRGQIQNSPDYKNFQTFHGTTQAAKRALENPSAYGDLSIIYATVKGMDPQSAVREGEVGLMHEMASLKNNLLGKLQTVANGQPLTTDQKQDAFKVLARMEAIAKDNLVNRSVPVLNQAKRAGLQLNEIDPLFDESAAAASTKGAWKVIR